MLLGLLLVLPAPATYRMQIAFAGYTNRSEPLTNFPVLVVFSNNMGGSGFDYKGFVTTNGYDLRFGTKLTDSGSLNYEIELWDTNSASYIWLQLPELPGDGSGAVWARWGDAGDSDQLACTTNGRVWSEDFMAVWHLEQANAHDACQNGHHGTSGGNFGTNGLIGSGQYFDGYNAYISLSHSATPVGGTGTAIMSMVCWVKPTQLTGQRPVYCENYNYYTKNFILLNNGNLLVDQYPPSGGSIASTSTISTQTWYHVAYIQNELGKDTRQLYINGVACRSDNAIETYSGSNPNQWSIGARRGSEPAYFSGTLDELRISSAARGSNWIWACWLNQASNDTFNTYGEASGTPLIGNRTPTDVTPTGATFNAWLASTGASPTTVYVLWGEEDGNVSGGWANTNGWNEGEWSDGSYPSTNLPLAIDRNYFYTFGAINAAGRFEDPASRYLITGGLTVEATDPIGRTNASDTAAFTVFRPSSCTNGALTVNYSLSGTATLGTDYTIAPAGGEAVIAEGEEGCVITVSPVYKQDGAKTVVLTLDPGLYAIGSPDSATCTLAKVTGTIRYWVAASSGNWSDTANWSDETGGPGGLSVPGSANLAIFDGGGSGECVINANASVLGFRLESGFSGTITQGVGRTISMGASGYSQAGGTFLGGNTNIGISEAGTAFSLSGGSFVSTRGQLYLWNSFEGGDWLCAGGTFDPNGGTVRMHMAWNKKKSLIGSVSFHNLWFATWGGQASYTIDSNTILTVHRCFTQQFTDGREGGYQINGGTIVIEGDLEFKDPWHSRATVGSAVFMVGGSDDQAIYGGGGIANLTMNKLSGVLIVTDSLAVVNLTLSSGVFRASSGTTTVHSLSRAMGATYEHNEGLISFGTENWGSTTINVGTQEFHNLTMAGRRGGRIGLSGGTLMVNNNLSITPTDIYGGDSTQINSGGIKVNGDVSIGAYARGGSATLALFGTNEQTVSVAAGGVPLRGHWTIDKSGGSVNLATNLNLTGTGQQLIWNNGGLNLGRHLLTVAGATTIGAGATTLDVTVADATTAGRLSCNQAVTGIENVGLYVKVSATPAEVEGRTYTIVSNSTVLGVEFETESWKPGWRGNVTYTENSGRNVTLSDLEFMRRAPQVIWME